MDWITTEQIFFEAPFSKEFTRIDHAELKASLMHLLENRPVNKKPVRYVPVQRWGLISLVRRSEEQCAVRRRFFSRVEKLLSLKYLISAAGFISVAS